MTYAENSHDLAHVDDEHASSGAPRRPLLVTSLFIAIALAVATDILLDALEGGSIGHVVVELAVMSVALLGAAILLRDLKAARARSRSLARDLVESHRDLERYQKEAAELVRGLGEAIDRQLDRWQLTDAEKEVAMLLLKGLSHKEVADVRGTSERTARGQARAVYQKAGLDSRAALSAFFLEDLLAPSKPGGGRP